jgi:hypothetical protein
MIESAARIELYVPERAVARHEVKFQQWVETVTAPLRYVSCGSGSGVQFCSVPLGSYIKDFEEETPHLAKEDVNTPRRQGMSAFSGFSVARDQRGIWFREGTGAPEEDRNTIYTFLVAKDLGEVAYFALRERLARTILRERNEQAVFLSRVLASEPGSETELVTDKQANYRDFAIAFNQAATRVCNPPKIHLAWKLLHLFQLLQRDLMASAKALVSPGGSTQSIEARDNIYRPLFEAILLIIEKVFDKSILIRMSTSIFVTWVKIARELKLLGDGEVANKVLPYVEQALKHSILQIADSLWRFQGHSLAGAADLGCDSCGVEAFSFVSALDTCQRELNLGLETLAYRLQKKLWKLWNKPEYTSFFVMRDWRGLSYCLNARNKKRLAAAFGLRTIDAITRSGISDERTWYRSMEDIFPHTDEKE